MIFSASKYSVSFFTVVFSVFGIAQPSASNAQFVERRELSQNSKTDGQVFFTVTASKNKSGYFTDLNLEHLTLTVDKQTTPISYFARSIEPMGVIFVIDQSGSMRSLHKEPLNKVCSLPEAISRFFLSNNRLNEYSIITFNREIRSRLEWTAGTDEIINHLKEICTELPKKQTALYDAITLAIEQAKESIHNRRIIVLFSDGDDNSSRQNYTSLKKAILESNVIIYSINTLSLFSRKFSYTPGQEKEMQQKEVLRDLAEMTGGEIISPADQNELAQALESILSELKNQYVIGFKSSSSADKKFHKIKLQVRETENLPPHLKNLSLRYREGYYSPPQAK